MKYFWTNRLCATGVLKYIGLNLVMSKAGPLGFCLAVAIILPGAAPEALGFIIDTSATPWQNTASGTRTANGQPATLTWGFVPDGTDVNDGISSLGGSDLITNLNTAFLGDPLETDHMLQPWFGFFNEAFARWTAVSGLTYVYESNDTGLNFASDAGVLGVRADVRIGGASVDGLSNTLAFNFFPNNSDMVLDTDDISFFADATGEHVNLGNTLTHEAGHGLGFRHVVSDTDVLLMEPNINTTIDGPQLDDIRGAHFYYGDALEKTNGGLGNNSAALAHSLGTILDTQTVSIGIDADIADQFISPDDTDFVSVSNTGDTDFYAFTVTEESTVDLQLKPLGGQFTQSNEFGTPTLFDASARADLSLTLWDTDGLTPLITVDAVPEGGIESILDFALPVGGEYFASITTTTDTVQLYRLDVSVESAVEPLPGDLDGDGFVGIDDLNIILANWNQNVPPADPLADPSADNFIGIDDLNIVLANFNTGTPPALDDISQVPEPGILATTFFSVFLLLRRKTLDNPA